MTSLGFTELLAIGATILGGISLVVNAWLQSQREKINNDIKHLSEVQGKIEKSVEELKEEMIKGSIRYPEQISQIQARMEEFKETQALQNEILNTIMIKLIKRLED